jgi:hypothetical protein
MKLDE